MILRSVVLGKDDESMSAMSDKRLHPTQFTTEQDLLVVIKDCFVVLNLQTPGCSQGAF